MRKKAIVVLSISSVLAVIGAVFLIFNSSCTDSSEYPGSHNLILIVSDALRTDVLGCYGGDVKTPHIDWLAQQGVLFDNAHSTAPCTLPSSVSILTGNYSRAYGIIQKPEHKNRVHKYSFYVNDSETLLAEVLGKAGYDVKMRVENRIASRSNNLQGFSKFRKSAHMSKKEIALVKNTIGTENFGRDEEGRVTRLYDLLHYLLTVPEEQNFFLLEWFLDPHGPYNPSEKFKKSISLEPGNLPMKEDFYSKGRTRTFNQLARSGKLSSDEYFYIKALYKAEVESIDERVGYIIKALKHRDLLQNTFIVFTSDHGELFGEHGRLGHGNNYYEELLHVPLIIMGPGIPKGKKEKTVVSLLGLMPTLKDLLDVTYDHHMQGKSFSALFHNNPIRDRVLYFDRVTNDITKKSNIDALLMNNYKLIVGEVKNRSILRLFNLADDPGEMKDLSAKAVNQPIFKKMFKKIMDLREENRIRLKRNLARISDDVDVDEEWKETLEQLKSFGYL